MNILFLGAGGPAAVGAIKSLFDVDSQGGHRIISVDCDELAVGFHFSDQSYVVPKINEEHYIEELLDIIEKENIDLILPTSNDVIPLSMNKDNIDAMMFMSDYDVIETCVDKFLFYKTCQSSFLYQCSLCLQCPMGHRMQCILPMHQWPTENYYPCDSLYLAHG